MHPLVWHHNMQLVMRYSLRWSFCGVIRANVTNEFSGGELDALRVSHGSIVEGSGSTGYLLTHMEQLLLTIEIF